VSDDQMLPWHLSQRWLDAAEIRHKRIEEDAAMGREDTPVHLRQAIDGLIADMVALATLIVRKGVATEQEVRDALAEQMEARAHAPRSWPSAN
jgi:hypothetical protein